MQTELFEPDAKPVSISRDAARTLVHSLASLVMRLEHTMADGVNLAEWARQLENIAWLSDCLRDALLLLAKEEREHHDCGQADGQAGTPGETGG